MRTNFETLHATRNRGVAVATKVRLIFDVWFISGYLLLTPLLYCSPICKENSNAGHIHTHTHTHTPTHFFPVFSLYLFLSHYESKASIANLQEECINDKEPSGTCWFQSSPEPLQNLDWIRSQCEVDLSRKIL